MPKSLLTTQQNDRRGSPFILSSAAFLLVMIGVMILYQLLEDREQMYVQNTISEEMERVKDIVNNETNLRLLAVKRMAQRWEAGNGTAYKVWKDDAISYMSRRPSVKAVEWVDSTYHVRWIEPSKDNENVIGMDIRFDEQRKQALKGAADGDSVILTPPLDLVQGYKGLIAYAPIRYNEKFDGFMVSIINVQEHFEGILKNEISDKYAVYIKQENDTFFTSAPHTSLAENFAAQDSLLMANNHWNIMIVPTKKLISKTTSRLPEAILIAGLFIALLSALSVRFMLLSRTRLDVLREREEQHRLILDGIDDYAIYMLNPEGIVKSWSVGAKKVTGYSEEEILGKHISIFYTPQDIENRAPENIMRTAKEEGKYAGEISRVRKGGSHYWASILMQPLYDTDKNLVGFAQVTRDITERRRLDQIATDMMLEKQKRLAEIVAIQREIGDSHHDLQHAMDVIAERTRAITDAEGGIVEMLEGNQMVYRAASGNATTFLGLRLSVNNSLSGLCLQQNTALKCDDAETDERVDKEACRKIGIRSMVVVPLTSQKHVVGVLKVLSSRTHAFNDEHIATLTLMAGVLSAALSDAMINDQLRQSEETFRAAMQYAPIGMAIVSIHGRWQKVNQALCTMLGYSEQELLKIDFQTITYADDLHSSVNYVEQLLTKKIESYQIEKRYVHKKGHPITVLLGVAVVRNTEGEPKYFIAQIQDITVRKQLELEQQKQAALLHLTHDAIFVRNQRDEITFWSRGAEAMYGWKSEEVLGRVTHDILNTVFPKPLQEILAEVKEKNQWKGELIHTRKDGSKITVASSWAIQPDKDGNPVGILEINRDVSEREELVQKLLNSNTELERFAYVASHDLQEPIRMVTNFSNIIATDYESKLDADGKEYLRIITEAGARMSATVNDLLAYSRVENETARFEDFDGRGVLNNALENLKVLIDDKRAKITCDDLPRLHGNPIQIVRVLQNLIANGIKYQPKNNTPRIHIGVTEQEEEWCICVKDNGLGIAEEFMQKIFEPFRRLHTWEAIKGTGLGLSISRKIIENHHGKLWVTSEMKKGSVFWFTLPKHGRIRQEAA